MPCGQKAELLQGGLWVPWRKRPENTGGDLEEVNEESGWELAGLSTWKLKSAGPGQGDCEPDQFPRAWGNGKGC